MTGHFNSVSWRIQGPQLIALHNPQL